MRDADWMNVEFEGTYQVAHPDGIKGQKVLRNFRVVVEMERSFLEVLEPFQSLRGPFATYYMGELREQFPGLIDLHRFRMIEATEIDGSKIRDHRAMSQEDLLQYIKDRRYPINTSFYPCDDLRHEVGLYEKDKKGQQHLQAHLEKTRGGQLAVTKRISERGAKMRILDVSEQQSARHDVLQAKIDEKSITTKEKQRGQKAQQPQDAGKKALNDMVSAYAPSSAKG